MTDFHAEETFVPHELTRKSTLISSLFLAIPLGLLLWLAFSILLNVIGVPVAGLIGFVLAAAATAGLFWIRNRQVTKDLSQSSMTVGPFGIIERNSTATRTVEWGDLRVGGMVTPVVGYSAKNVLMVRDLSAPVDALAGAAAIQELGLLALGRIDYAPGISAIQRKTYEQNVGRNGVDPQSGQPYIALYPAHYQLKWPTDRIGEWVKVYRPDIWEQAHAIQSAEDKNNEYLKNTSLRQVAKDAWAEGKAEREAAAAGAQPQHPHEQHPPQQ